MHKANILKTNTLFCNRSGEKQRFGPENDKRFDAKPVAKVCRLELPCVDGRASANDLRPQIA